MASDSFRVCVVGCGASGILSVRSLVRHGITDVVAYESKSFSSGVWNYIENSKSHNATPMYKQLQTDIPFDIMILPDYSINDFKNSLQTANGNTSNNTNDIKFDEFVSHTVIKDYLNCYENHYDIEKYIEYNTEVINIKELKNNINTKCKKQFPKWQVTTRGHNCNNNNEMNKKANMEIKENTENKDEKQNEKVEIFDAVFICNGHYNHHIIPKFEGLDKCEIPYVHSFYYRDCLTIDSKNFVKDKRILLVGNGPSGRDIIQHVYNQCEIKKVYHVARIGLWHMQYYQEMKDWDFNGKYVLKSGIKKFEGKSSVVFDDDTKVDDIDFILFCTGYRYNYKFINKDTFITGCDYNGSFLNESKENKDKDKDKDKDSKSGDKDDNNNNNNNNNDNNNNDSGKEGLGFVCNGLSVGYVHNYMFYADNPSLVFIGLPALNVPFLISYFQSELAANLLKAIKTDDIKAFNKLLLCDSKNEKELIAQTKKRYTGTKLDVLMNMEQFSYMSMICNVIDSVSFNVDVNDKDNKEKKVQMGKNALLKLIEERKMIWVTRVAQRWMPKVWPVDRFGPMPDFAKEFYKRNNPTA